MTDDQWSKVLDITLTGTFRCVRAAGQRFVAAGKKGVIVNNASVIGWRAQEGQAHYAAAKAGVMALTRCAAIDLAPHGIRVNAVSPSLAMHPFLAKVTSDELLARAQAARGVRPRGRAVGGRQRDGVPGQRLRVVHDRRGRRRLEPAGLMTADQVERLAPTTQARASCSRSRRGCSPRRASATPPSATSPTPPGSCRAASTTTSTPRSRWSTRSSRRSRRSSSASTTRSWPATPDPLAKLEQAVLVSFDAIDKHRDEVAIFQNDAAYLLTFERFAYLGRAQPAVPRGLADPAAERHRRRRPARRPRPRAHLPLHPRHHLGRGLLVPPRRPPHAHRDRQAVPLHPARRDPPCHS